MFGRALAGRDGRRGELGAIRGENGGRGAGAFAVSMRRSISSLMTTERGAPESCITSAISECSSGVHLMAHAWTRRSSVRVRSNENRPKLHSLLPRGSAPRAVHQDVAERRLECRRAEGRSLT